MFVVAESSKQFPGYSLKGVEGRGGGELVSKGFLFVVVPRKKIDSVLDYQKQKCMSDFRI